jgi:hypothetical protein
MDAAKGREVFVEWRSEDGRVKMGQDYGNKGAEEGGRVPMKEDDLN